jgi:hypothetical protein
LQSPANVLNGLKPLRAGDSVVVDVDVVEHVLWMYMFGLRPVHLVVPSRKGSSQAPR